MLSGLYAATIVLFFLFAVGALFVGHFDVFLIKGTLAALLVVLFTLYLRSGETPLYAAFFLLVIELESLSAMFGGHFYDFVTIYPFFAVFGFFFFFSLRSAFVLTGAHILLWLFFAAAVFNENAANPVFHHVPLINMLSTTLVVVFIGVIYHLSTELTYARLEKADRQKALLLKEIHHRIKNNLNKISSLLGLQILRLPDTPKESVEEILKKNKLRIETMAMVHETLYKADDLDRIDAGNYLTHLAKLIQESYGASLEVEIETDGISLPLEKMLLLGMAVNELITNTIKHTPGDEIRRPKIAISLHRQEDGSFRFDYVQEGEFSVDPVAFEKSGGLGITLINLSAKELGGDLRIAPQEGRLRFTILFH